MVIAAPTTAHAPLGLAAIARGLPVLVEKPLAATVAEGIELVGGGTPAACRSRSATWSGSTRRCWSSDAGSRRLARGLYSIASRRAGPFPARIRDVGVTIDLATHDADILSWVAGERPTRVYAEIAQRLHASHEDLLFGLLHFPSGATGMLDVNWLTPAKRRQLSVVGEAGMFELDYLTQRLTFTSADVGSPTIIDGYATTFEGNVVVIDVASREPLAAELDAFLAVALAAAGRSWTARTGCGRWRSPRPSWRPRPRSAGRPRRASLTRPRLPDDDRARPSTSASMLGGTIDLPETRAPTARPGPRVPWTGEPGTAGTVGASSARARWACRSRRSSPPTAGP